jgi:uracil-DNA glycosylase
MPLKNPNLNPATALLDAHVRQLLACRRCPQMLKPVVSGGAVVSKVMLVGQAPGDKEPVLGRPFAWTAGKTLFRWFNEAAGMSEETFRQSIYMAAVCRCFPVTRDIGGDRVPSPDEVQNCSAWLKREVEILQPELVLPVGKLAIAQFIPLQKLDVLIGQSYRVTYAGHTFDLIPLPHPSGASPWHRMEPGKTLLKNALQLVAKHPAFKKLSAPKPAHLSISAKDEGRNRPA